MKYIFFLSMILISCSSTHWKQKYRTKYFAKIRKQYASKEGNLSFAYVGQLPKKTLTGSDSNIVLNRSWDVTIWSKKELRQRMQILERAAATYPDSVRRNNKQADTIFMNPYKIKYIERHGLKTSNMIFIDTVKR